MPWIASEILLSSPLQSATGPAALPEEFGPHEPETDAKKLSAKLPEEHAPSVAAELPLAVAAYALGNICCTVGATNIAAFAATAATIKVRVKIIFLL